MGATAPRTLSRSSWRSWVGVIVMAPLLSANASAEQDRAEESEQSRENPVRSAALFLAGTTTGLLAHEGGHVLFDVAFDADPGLRRVEFAGVPFFAITHRSDLSPRREYAVSAAGFWSQHALSEWVLTTHPDLRTERRPFLRGLLAWHLASSAVYTIAATGRIGPAERDTRGMAAALGISERWLGVLLAVPAVCDTWRYFNPEAGWARWVSRAAKVGLVVVVAAARG